MKEELIELRNKWIAEGQALMRAAQNMDSCQFSHASAVLSRIAGERYACIHDLNELLERMK